MPFTFSHPAVIVPSVKLFKGKFSVTGLVAGSTVPDLEYFLRMNGLSRYSHTWTGLFWFDLPAGVAVAFLFHNLLRNPLVNNLSPWFRSRLQDTLSFNWNTHFLRTWPVVLFSILLGAASHLLWDRFTHAGAAWLRELIEGYKTLDDEDDFLIYYLFFGLNSIAGLILLFRYARNLPRQRLRTKKDAPTLYWTTTALTAIAVFFFRLVLSGDLRFLGYIDSVLAAIMIGMIVASLKEKWKAVT